MVVAASLLFYGCGNKVTVTDERLYFVSGFGHFYRIEVATEIDTISYVFVGSYEELKTLDDEISIGNRVKIDNNSTAFSSDGEKVLIPSAIKRLK